MVPRSRSRTTAGGGQDGGDGEEDHADHAGDHEVGRDHIGVVPDGCAQVHRRLQLEADPAARQLLCQQARGVILSDELRSRKGGCGHGRVRAIQDERHLRFSFLKAQGIIGRDDQADTRLPSLDELAQLGVGVNRICQHKIIGSAVRIQQGAPFGAVTLVEHRDGYVAHLVCGGITEQEELNQG